MNDLRRSLERSAARFEPPSDWFRRLEDRRRRKHRNERIGAAVVGLSVCAVVLVGVANLRGDGTTPAATPTSSATPTRSGVVFRDTFEPGGTAWPTQRDPRFSFRYVAGAYEISSRQPFGERYWIRRVLDPIPIVDVQVGITWDASGTSGWAGVMCPYSFAPAPDDGYAFVVSGGGVSWRILKVLEDQTPEVLAQGFMGSIEPGSDIENVVHGRCELLEPGRAELTIRVGDETASVIDEAGPEGFIGVGMFVQAGAEAAIARFDDLRLAVP